MHRINPYVFPIKGDISRADAVTLYEEATKVGQSYIMEFGIGGSTIFLGLSYLPVIAVENEQGWINRVQRNVNLYNGKLPQKMNVEFLNVNYGDTSWITSVRQKIKRHRPRLYSIDCLTKMRGSVLDLVITEAHPGDVILLHDTRSPTPHKFITDNLLKHYNRIDTFQANLNNSNTSKITIKRETPYINWNQEEAGNNRLDWGNEDIGI